jgi:hypothetical protein
MKTCNKCKILRNENEFYKNSSRIEGIHSICKYCMLEYAKTYYKEHPKLKDVENARAKARFITMQSRVNKIKHDKGCMFCDEKEPCCLDFHHKDKKNKIACISTLVSKKSWKNIEIEIQKCVIVCSNCHRKLHKGIQLTPKLEMLKTIAPLV